MRYCLHSKVYDVPTLSAVLCSDMSTAWITKYDLGRWNRSLLLSIHAGIDMVSNTLHPVQPQEYRGIHIGFAVREIRSYR